MSEQRWPHSSRVYRLAVLVATVFLGVLAAPTPSGAQEPPFVPLAPCTAPPPSSDGWPVAGIDSLIINGPSVTFSAATLLANDRGSSLNITAVGPISSGGGRITGSGPYTFTPVASFFTPAPGVISTDIFTYQLSGSPGETTIGIVRVTLGSVGTVPVPNLVGSTRSAAESALTGAALTVGVITTANSATVPAGQVSVQNPVAGATVAPGAAVDFTVSDGPANITVPAIVGLTQTTAQSAITNAGLTVGAITSATTGSVPAGQVLAQNPGAGASVPPGSVVTFVLSLGPATVTVPSVVGMTQTVAQSTIASAGLTVGTITSANSASVPAGQVMGQNPSAGASVAPNTSVSFVLSLGAANVSVPSVLGLTQSAAQSAITGASLTIGTITSANSSTVPAGQVSSQNPSAGVTAAPNSPVAIVLSLGPAAGGGPTVVATATSDGVGTRTTGAFSAPAGAVLVAFGASDGPSSVNSQTLTISGAGLTWTRVQRAATRYGDAEIWTTTAAAPLTNVTVTSTQAAGGFQQSLTVVAFTGVSGIGASSVAGTVGTAASAANASLVTQAAGSVVYGVGSDWDNVTARTVPAGQTKVREFVATNLVAAWVQKLSGITGTAGSTVALNSTPSSTQWNFAIVELRSAGGATTTTVPGVLGLTQSAAQSAITGASLTVGTITSANSASVPAGQVMSQTPSAGASVAPNSPVSFVLSLGAASVSVPSVLGLTQAAAQGAITGASLTVGTITSANSASVPAGQVMSQTPSAGASVAPGAAVNIVLSLGPLSGGGPAVQTTVFSDGSGTRTTPAFSTTSAGQVLLAFAASDGPAASNGQTLTISGAGLTWTRVQRAATRYGVSEIWTARAATVLTNVTVRSTQSSGGFLQSLTVVAFTGVSGIGASNTAGAASGAPSVSLVTQAAGSLVYAVGNDWDRAVARTIPAAQTKVHELVNASVGDTFWVQALAGPVASAGTTVTLNATGPTNDQWNFAIVELKR